MHMQRGFLSKYFEGLALKRLSAVEVDSTRSNQHEFNGTIAMQALLGKDRREYLAQYLYLGEGDERFATEGSLTWYDARENHPNRSEYRLYFKRNIVIDEANEGDLLIVAKRPNEEILIIVVPADSSFENQVLWLFGIEHVDSNFSYQSIQEGYNPEISFAVRYILKELGIETDLYDIDWLDYLIEPYLLEGFPSTDQFTILARKTLEEVSPIEEPDNAILQWVEHEERLFRRLEYHLVSRRLKKGFINGEMVDVEGFISFSLSVQNRRKSRAGYSLEKHLIEIFKLHRITFSHEKQTEHKTKPDFIFPSIDKYHNMSYPSSGLTMLGVKTTCKDRWRQVLAEAARIDEKHLFTLQPAISENQTDEMKANKLQLVIPDRLHDTYSCSQRSWLMNLRTFLCLVKERQIMGMQQQ